MDDEFDPQNELVSMDFKFLDGFHIVDVLKKRPSAQSATPSRSSSLYILIFDIVMVYNLDDST